MKGRNHCKSDQVNPSPSRDVPGGTGLGAAGAGIGWASAIFGIGGGTLTVPFLSWCNVRMQQAVATSQSGGQFPAMIDPQLEIRLVSVDWQQTLFSESLLRSQWKAPSEFSFQWQVSWRLQEVMSVLSLHFTGDWSWLQQTASVTVPCTTPTPPFRLQLLDCHSTPPELAFTTSAKLAIITACTR